MSDTLLTSGKSPADLLFSRLLKINTPRGRNQIILADYRVALLKQ